MGYFELTNSFYTYLIYTFPITSILFYLFGYMLTIRYIYRLNNLLMQSREEDIQDKLKPTAPTRVRFQKGNHCNISRHQKEGIHLTQIFTQLIYKSQTCSTSKEVHTPPLPPPPPPP